MASSIEDKLELLYPALDTDIITLVVDNAKDYILTYCNIPAYQAGLDTLAFKMAQEDINKLQAEGYTSESAGGNTVQYSTDYTEAVMRLLNKNKHIVTV